MTKQEFLNAVLNATDVQMRCYRSGPNVNPDDYPFILSRPYVQSTHNGEMTLITPNAAWAEYSPKYDIDSFDGTTMVFVAEDYVMEIRL